MTKEGELFEAYHTVAVEARHIIALTQRMVILINAAKQNLHKLENTLHRVQDLEQEVAAKAPPGGAA
jgi:hypothetical protein